MSEKINLSIVIPVFNVEKYLPTCMESLLATEGIEDTEIILVDDGSTDGSLKIADDYSRRYDNVKVFHKENEGPSAARNLGLEKSSGNYVFFCDSDDEVVPDLFSRVIRMAAVTNHEIILWDSDLLYETISFLVNNNRGFFAHKGVDKIERIYTGKEFIETLLRRSGNFVAAVWLGAYRRDYLLDNGFTFEYGLIHEDELWVPQVMLKASDIYYYPEKLYRYRVHKGSIMNPNTHDRRKHVDSLMKIYPSLYSYYDEMLAGEPLRELIEGNLTKKYLHMIYKFNIIKYGYADMIDKKLLWRTSRRIIDKVMVLLLYVYVFLGTMLYKD